MWRRAEQEKHPGSIRGGAIGGAVLTLRGGMGRLSEEGPSSRDLNERRSEEGRSHVENLQKSAAGRGNRHAHVWRWRCAWCTCGLVRWPADLDRGVLGHEVRAAGRARPGKVWEATRSGQFLEGCEPDGRRIRSSLNKLEAEP